MKEIKLIMGMPIVIEVIDPSVSKKDLEEVFNFFISVDKKFSPYKKNSEVSKMNSGILSIKNVSEEMQEIIELCKKTKEETNKYFDAYHNGKFDPSGVVKGWAIKKGANMLKEKGFKDFYIEAGGDIQVSGKNKEGRKWKIGIRNPFNTKEIVKVIYLTDGGIATSGEYERGEHIYNPHSVTLQKEVVSISVIASSILDADRFATAAFAMGKNGIIFLKKQKNLESYMIDKEGIATYTSSFGKYTKQ